jgi:hypothetical protein
MTKVLRVGDLPADQFGEDYLEFALTTYGRRAQPNYPGGFEIYVDTNGDGESDILIFNLELGGFAVTGQSAVCVYDLNTDAFDAYFLVDADFNSGNMIFTVPLATLGVAPGTTLDFSAYAYDNYFTNLTTDATEGMRFTPCPPRFAAADEPFGSVPARGRASLLISANDVPDAASNESGLLLLFRRNALIESQIVNRAERALGLPGVTGGR